MLLKWAKQALPDGTLRGETMLRKQACAGVTGLEGEQCLAQ